MQNKATDFDISGKIAVVTGASEGIGRAIALGLAGAGADLILCSRRREKLLEVKNEISLMGRNAEVYVADIRNPVEIDGLANYVRTVVGRVDILINNAGYAVSVPAWSVSENDWDIMVDTGLKGVFFCSKAIGRLMREQHYGKIINISSTFSRSIIAGRAVYAAVKAGVNHLTEALAMEWAEDGIRVNAIAPTAINTPSRSLELQGPTLEKVLARIPLGRLANPEDLLGAVIFFASEASDFITGQTLFVDGGWIAAS